MQRKKPKVKNKIKKVRKTERKNTIKPANIKSCHQSNKMVSATNTLVKKLRKKLNANTLSKNDDDKTLLNNGFSSPKGSTNKKGLKRKRSLALNEGVVSPKKAKKKINGHQQAELITNEQQISTFAGDIEHSKKRKKKKKKNAEIVNKSGDIDKQVIDKKIVPLQLKKRKEQLQKLRKLVIEKEEKKSPQRNQEPVLTLRQRMTKKLKAARFRFLNEQIYTMTSQKTDEIFKRDPEAFKTYHEGFNLQVKKWPLNPLDNIIKSVSKMNRTHIIADFGCGEAKLAKSVQQKVHSFDLVALNETVTACDMAHVPLRDSSVDVAVFCLSLMGTNLKDYLIEANRVLKQGGVLKIAEVETRFEDINAFIKDCVKFGFKETWKDLSYNLFYFIDFKKVANIKDKKKLPSVTLQPCLYKKR